MSSYEPFIIIFGTSKSILSVNLRLPISFLFAVDESSLEELITTDPPYFNESLRRYFIILLESIDNDFFNHIHNNHRVQIIYSIKDFNDVLQFEKLRCIKNKSWQKITLDLTTDVVHFLTIEGEKQAREEQIHLAQVYYRQARLLKEWAMTFIKAEPSHILLIPLNTSQENVDNAIERLDNVCTELGYSSTIIRKLNDYIPIDNEEKSDLIPYSSVLFSNENPHYLCDLIKKLSPLRFYLYGNDCLISSDWSNLMITRETQVMEDEDNWCAFLENEPIDDELKWNFGSMFGGSWKVNRISPILLNSLNKSLRFQSALRRAFKTFSQRQIEVTSEVFDWYDKCVQKGHLRLEPQLTNQQEDKIRKTEAEIEEIFIKHTFRCPPTVPRVQTSLEIKGNSFIWLSESENYPQQALKDTIQPSHWECFDNISTCVPYITIQLRERKRIFLVLSSSLGRTLYVTCYHLMSMIPYVYVYCPEFCLSADWTRNFDGIHEVHRVVRNLHDRIRNDLNTSYPLRSIDNSYDPFSASGMNLDFSQTDSNTPTSSSAWIVCNQYQVHFFLAHQRDIDILLYMPRTDESRNEMFAEFRQFCNNNSRYLNALHRFEEEYDSHNAVHWYSRETFLCNAVNHILRTDDVDKIFKIRHFLTDLYRKLSELHISRYENQSTITVYRGQHISRLELESFKTLCGCFISAKMFISATKVFEIAEMFATATTNTVGLVPVIFSIIIDPNCHSVRPFADISRLAYFPDEEEVLFAMGSIFRVQSVITLNGHDISQINLQLVDQDTLRRDILVAN